MISGTNHTDRIIQAVAGHGLQREWIEKCGNEAINRALTSCSRWASRRRIMAGDFPGPYSWKHHPWVRAMMDCESPYGYAMKGAQLGVSEVAINRAFYVLDALKRDVLYVLPTATVASDFSKARFGSALKLSPHLKGIFTDTNSVNLKQTEHCNLYIRGSRGDSNLVSIPVSELILDELDRMDEQAVELAQTRLAGQLRKVVFALSTPTIHNFGIHRLFQTGTQEHFHFRCPHCSRFTELVWPDSFMVVGDSISDPRCAESFIVCKECRHRLDHETKPEWLADAIWRPSVPNPNYDIRSWYINQLYSFTETPERIAREWHKAQADDYAEQEFHNSKMGMPFIADGAQVSDQEIDEAKGNYRAGDNKPKRGGKRLIVLGIDQGKLCHWVAAEYLVQEMSFDINMSAFCKVLDFGKFPEDDWEHRAAELMSEWQVQACVVDADPQINEARNFAKRFPGYVWLCRYRSGKVAKEIAITEADTGAPLATVDRTNWLSASLGRYRRKRITTPMNVSLEFMGHMKALVRTWERDENNNPRAVFRNTGPDHYAHALNYCEIALPLAASISTGQNIEKFL